jgi:hypothetical protein
MTITAAVPVKEEFNKPKVTASQVVRYHRNGQWDSYDISDVIRQLLKPYYDAVYGDHADFGGQDPLEAVGQADMLKRFLNGGRGIPQQTLDELMISMVETGSLRGVQICREAGADYNSFYEPHGSGAMDKALTIGRLDMTDAMKKPPATVAAPVMVMAMAVT